MQEVIDNRTFLKDVSLKCVRTYEREDNVKFIMCVNEARYDLACILRYDHCLDIWEHEDYTFIIKNKFDDLIEEFEVIRDEVTREEVTRDEVTRDEVTRDEVTREEVTRDEVTRDEVTRDEVTREEVTREEVTRDEVTREEVTRDEVTRDEVIRKNILEELEHVHDEIFTRLKALEESAKTQDIETSEPIDINKIIEQLKRLKLNIAITIE